jgi:serine/threonine-protein kinase RsbW
VSVISLAFPARAEYLVLARLVLSGLARVQPIEPDALGDAKLALTEACSNSIRHAYADGAGRVHVRYEVSDDALVLEVHDDGIGFVPGPAREPVGEDLDEGGLGLEIIRALCDSVEIGAGPSASGLTIRFVKQLQRQSG